MISESKFDRFWWLLDIDFLIPRFATANISILAWSSTDDSLSVRAIPLSSIYFLYDTIANFHTWLNVFHTSFLKLIYDEINGILLFDADSAWNDVWLRKSVSWKWVRTRFFRRTWHFDTENGQASALDGLWVKEQMRSCFGGVSYKKTNDRIVRFLFPSFDHWYHEHPSLLFLLHCSASHR